MKQKNRFIFDMLDQDSPDSPAETIWKGGRPERADERDGAIIIRIPYHPLKRDGIFLKPDEDLETRHKEMTVRSYGDSIVRLTIPFGSGMPDDEANPMLEWDAGLKQTPLSLGKTGTGYDFTDSRGRTRMSVDTGDYPVDFWSDLQPEPLKDFAATVCPDGKTAVPFMAYDNFFPHQPESFSTGFVEKNGAADRCLFSLHARPDEKFAGTGERFTGMNLSGKTLYLENTDALGVNNRRAYKNIPFYVSSKGYGLLIMTSAHVRLSLADISTRAAQGMVEEDTLDLFFIGGDTVESIVRRYRRITGFPRKVPDWTYGTWMSKMTYFSGREVRDVVGKMRNGKFPLDVIHLDSGWFEKDWKCEWEFSKKNFPEPEKFLEEMIDEGIRISLWQLPFIAKDTIHYEEALQKGYIACKGNSSALDSVFSAVEFSGTIDFSNPEAVLWYQGLIGRLLKMGAAVIKTDFGEAIENSEYASIPYGKLHNLYSLLYHKAAFEISETIKGKDNALIWARAGWTGCHRYPLHWGGDSACSWDGMAGSVRGGLHLGVSGFAFWSHDIPGFHGIPSFMNSRPSDDLYVRWTQLGVFTSHLRFHGSNVREPYEYGEVSAIVRKWLNLRYSLIPYISREGRKATESGFPVFRALIFHHGNDPVCWNIDDEYYFGDSFLIAPVMNGEGIRDIYLPEGRWTDFWTGAVYSGPKWLKGERFPLDKAPVYVKSGDVIPVYPRIVQSTDQMDPSMVVNLPFDGTYGGFSDSVLGEIIDL